MAWLKGMRMIYTTVFQTLPLLISHKYRPHDTVELEKGQFFRTLTTIEILEFSIKIILKESHLYPLAFIYYLTYLSKNRCFNIVEELHGHFVPEEAGL